MRANRIRGLWDQGKPVVNGWLTIDSSYSTELMAGQEFDSVTVELSFQPKRKDLTDMVRKM
jgi:4-hydroxy-2-oxoheptanedioate aldolase